MNWDDLVLVGRIARPHGLKGHVLVNPETDFAEERFVEGATLWTRSSVGDEEGTRNQITEMLDIDGEPWNWCSRAKPSPRSVRATWVW